MELSPLDVAGCGGVATLVGFKWSLNQRRAPSVPRVGGQMPGSWGGRLRGSGLWWGAPTMGGGEPPWESAGPEGDWAT